MLVQDLNLIRKLNGKSLQDTELNDLLMEEIRKESDENDANPDDLPVCEISDNKTTRVRWQKNEIKEIEDYFPDNLRTFKTCP
ncbi:uncharacterized protein LOC127733627 [Mytilus californianus]|uniref:uncharacterized protein LOC127733627 n=1 Tax=Mytilus californianus TaxID=6549 RepID=UPI002246C50D|nr:uncharacterized protein LOC127733627 [Mytilus californianus]